MDIMDIMMAKAISGGSGGGGAGGVFYVDAEITSSGGQLIGTNPSHTFSETVAAINAGENVMMRLDYTGVATFYCPLMMTQFAEGSSDVAAIAFLMCFEVFWSVGYLADGTISFMQMGG